MAFISIFNYSNEPALLFSISLAIGYCAAAIFPIDHGAPLFGTWKNVIHNLSAGVSYVLALGGFEYLALEFGFPYSLGKFFIMAFITSLYIPIIRNFRGLLQRAAEAGIFSALIICLYQSNA